MKSLEPNYSPQEIKDLIARAMKEHADCVSEWEGADPRTLRHRIYHPIEFHLPPGIGRLHLSRYRGGS